MTPNLQHHWDAMKIALARFDYEEYAKHEATFMTSGSRGIAFLREQLEREQDARIIFATISKMPELDKREFLPELLDWGCAYNYTGRCWDIITSLDEEWLQQNIESATRPFLKTGDENAWRQILSLIRPIDSLLHDKLALEATQSTDPEIVALGFYNLEED
ncbi:hypothetical protein IAD21_00093 [Abditibacteriota bacterium]|nr:hypothetical protein IAD21_00093 [Abditibacteriota bacterium]